MLDRLDRPTKEYLTTAGSGHYTRALQNKPAKEVRRRAFRRLGISLKSERQRVAAVLP
jgi:hypothetical protein